MKFIVFALAALLSTPCRAVDVQVVISGKFFRTLDVYRVETAYYLSSDQAAAVFGGQVYWSPVSGRVQLSIHGRQVRFSVDSTDVSVDGQAMKLPRPVMVRTSLAFIPLEFFLTKEFGELAGVDCQFNPGTGLLNVDKRVTTGPLQWFSYKGYTRIALSLAPGLTYYVAKHGRYGFDVTVPFGSIDAPEVTPVKDDIVESIRLQQQMKAAKLSVRLEKSGEVWNLREADPPRRLIIDVYPDADSMKTAAVEPPESTPLPPPEPKTPAAPPAAVPKTAAATAPAPASPAAVPASAVPAARVPAGPEPSHETPVIPPPQTSVPAKPAASNAPAAANPPPAPAVRVRHRIVVDAGHGGKDSGATGRHGTLEKSLNLLAAKELASLLREEGVFDVRLTRDDDTFIPLDERSQTANDFNADLFISLHCNASIHRSENGYEIYFLSERATDPESQRVADAENAALQLEGKNVVEETVAPILNDMARTEFINDASKLAGLITKNISKRVDLSNRAGSSWSKQAAFYVLRGTHAPAILVEMGFITNSRDEAKLQSKRFRRRLIDGIYAGILDYARMEGWSTRK